MIAVFLDRDGVVIKDKNYQYKVADLELIEGASDSIKRLNAAGFLVIIVSNQSGIARGYFTEKDLEEFNSALLSEFKERGAMIDAIYYCPHHPTEAKVKKYMVECDCRKPKPGILLKAAKEHGIELSKSWMIGDKESDVFAGKAAGCRTVLIGRKNALADYSAKDLNEAVDYILRTR